MIGRNADTDNLAINFCYFSLEVSIKLQNIFWYFMLLPYQFQNFSDFLAKAQFIGVIFSTTIAFTGLIQYDGGVRSTKYLFDLINQCVLHSNWMGGVQFLTAQAKRSKLTGSPREYLLVRTQSHYML
jgi:hypothetical protein